MATERYAGFWIRVGAALIDGAILLLPCLGISWLFHMGLFDPTFHFHFHGHVDRAQAHPMSPQYIAWSVLLILMNMVYEVWTTASTLQGTPGKNCCGIKVVDYQGQTLSLSRSFGRYFAKSIWGVLKTAAQPLLLTTEGLDLIPLVDCLAVAFTPKKQALHDYAAKTLVIHHGDEVPGFFYRATRFLLRRTYSGTSPRP